MIKVNYSTIKTFSDARVVPLQYLEDNDDYILYAFDGPFAVYCRIEKDNADGSDFDANRKASANKPIHKIPNRSIGIHEAETNRARLKGIFNGTITAGTSKNFDFQMSNLPWSGQNKLTFFDGFQYYAKNAAVGDHATFQVVDVDGLVYPAGTVLDEFGDEWYISPDTMTTLRLFRSNMIAGFYIRLVYQSTGGTDVKFVGNLYRYLDTSVDA